MLRVDLHAPIAVDELITVFESLTRAYDALDAYAAIRRAVMRDATTGDADWLLDSLRLYADDEADWDLFERFQFPFGWLRRGVRPYLRYAYGPQRTTRQRLA